MPASERMISTAAGLVHVRESGGDGPTIVMLHGSGSSAAVFARQFGDGIAERHRLVALDLPGHGKSADAADPSLYTLKGLTDIVSDVLDKLGITCMTIFGWSLGGHLAIQLAAERPDVDGIMLTGAPPVSRGPLGLLRGFQAHWDLFLASKKVFSERDVVRFAELCFGEEPDPQFFETIGRTDGRLRVEFFRSLLRGDFTDQKRFVETSTTPIAILNGAEDPFVRLPYLDNLDYAALWRQRCHVVPGTGHAPFWHTPELFNPLLAAFTRDVAGRSLHQRAAPRMTA